MANKYDNNDPCICYADMVKLADTLDLGSNAERCAGSSPVIRTSQIVGIMTLTQPSKRPIPQIL